MTAYDTAVLADSPLMYWEMAEPSGTTMTDSSGNSHNGTFSAVTLGATGIGDGATAASFNGTSSFASAAIDLTAQNKITLEFWLKEASWGTTDALGFEFSTNQNTNAGTFLVDPNLSTPSGNVNFGVSKGDGTNYNQGSIPQPSANAWHHFVMLLDRTVSTPPTAYVDAVVKTTTPSINTTMGDNFASNTLYIMSRAGTSLFNTGTMSKVAIYAGLLSSTQVTNHFNAAIIPPDLTTLRTLSSPRLV